ncbi:MAG: YidC/Oxa1 family membrane protein insertase [Candidatus Margulisbacteria bacterium]|nr:YidC/Oxa1 family membrane protein insertase [Candidatus Margulisiibacteriota bacterium]
MLEILKFFYAIGGHNWGFAIIWLTITINLALYPLTLSSIQQMAAMQRIQPRLQELQKKHKDDPKKLQKEMMDLYKVEGVNPLGGCLPVLLKIPFFLALFWSLQSKEFTTLVGQGAIFIPGWINDITRHDPFFILPLLIGVSTWLSQKSMPAAPGQGQAMLWFMPIFITFISYNFAAGVQLYWVISNLIGWAQQSYIMTQRVPKKF